MVIIHAYNSSLEENIDLLWRQYAPAFSLVLPHVSFYAESVDLMLASVEGRKHVLDLGCGPGIVSERLALLGNLVVGVDNDKVMVDYARKRLENFPNAKIEKQDAHSLSFEPKKFDGVVCNNVLYYVENPIRVVEEAHRVLKNGGIFSVSGPLPTYNPDVLFKQMMEDLAKKGLAEAFREEIEIIIKCNRILAERGIRNPFFNEELERLLKDNGFSNITNSRLIYLGQCYFISAVKGPISEHDLLRHDVVKDNIIVSGQIKVPDELKRTTIDGFELGVATTPTEMLELFKLRYIAYSRAGLFKSGTVNNGYDFDRFDKHAVLFYARNRRTGRIEATVRLILDSEDGLYLESSYNIGSMRTNGRRLAEGSRLAADPERTRLMFNNEVYGLSDLVLNLATEFASQIGVTHIMGLSRKKLEKFFTRNGYFPMENGKIVNLKDGKINPQEDLYPVVLDTKAFPSLFARSYV